MIREFKHLIGRKEFSFIFDKEAILVQMEEERKKYEEGLYQRYYTRGYEDGYLSREEYEENLDKMIARLDAITTETAMMGFIETAHKKKNGTFFKGRIALREGCDNTEYITEWHNTWIYNALCISAIDDFTLQLVYVKYVNTPG